MTRERPNILIIYPDQMRYDVMGCAGNPVIKTPNFDRLASGGVMFNNAFCAYPLCAPWRASIMTGKYPHANGMGTNHYPIPLDQLFLAELLRDHAGYQTGYVGKWHLDGGRKHAFVRPEGRPLQRMLEEHMAATGDDWGMEMVFPPPDFQTHEEGDRWAAERLKSAVVEN